MDAPARGAVDRAAPSATVTGRAAGVPFVARPPATGSSGDVPVVVTWHLLDPPRTPAAFATALPLDGLDAWRIHLGLPETGERLPPGGWDELMHRGYQDAVLELQGPIIEGAAAEFPAAFAALTERLELGSRRVGVLGGSAGAAVAQLLLVEGQLEAGAAVLVSPLVRLRTNVDAMARRFGFTYPWTDDAVAVAARLDFVARAAELGTGGERPAVLIVTGEDDDAGIVGPAHELAAQLRTTGPQERVRSVSIPGMAHALADGPGDEPAPQTPHAAEVDRLATAWYQAHL